MSGSPAASLTYDAAGRLMTVSASATTRFVYDGDDIVAEYNGTGGLLRRYVHGPGADEPLVWYEGQGTADRRWLVADERGSVIAGVNASGSVLFTNTYDEYGQPGTNNQGRFQYTGQAWIPEAGLYHYKARAYLPSIGRFLQTDPLGYAAGMNLYAYVGGDPVNLADPSGMQENCSDGKQATGGQAARCDPVGNDPGSTMYCYPNDPLCSAPTNGTPITVTAPCGGGAAFCTRYSFDPNTFRQDVDSTLPGTRPAWASGGGGQQPPSARELARRRVLCESAEQDEREAKQYGTEALAYAGLGLAAGELPPVSAALELGASMSEGMAVYHSVMAGAKRYMAGRDPVPLSTAVIGYALGRASGLKGFAAVAAGKAGDVVTDVGTKPCGG